MSNHGSDYTPERTHAAVLEEQKRLAGERCGESSVENVTPDTHMNFIEIRGVRHAGAVAHVCARPRGHESNHMCADGHEWRSR